MQNEINCNQSRFSQLLFFLLDYSQLFSFFRFLPQPFLLLLPFQLLPFLLFLPLFFSNCFLLLSNSFLLGLLCQITQFSTHLAGIRVGLIDIRTGIAGPFPPLLHLLLLLLAGQLVDHVDGCWNRLVFDSDQRLLNYVDSVAHLLHLLNHRLVRNHLNWLGLLCDCWRIVK
jgi:hypothetical protein